MNYGRFSNVSRPYVSAWARKALSLPNLAILDTETTGQSWHGGFDEVVELCIIDRSGSPLINTLVRPEGLIHPEAAGLSGITDEMVADAPLFDQLAEAVGNILRDRGVIIFNADYDAPLLRFEFERCSVEFPACHIRCAKLAYAAYRQIPGRRYGEYKWHGLQAACAHEGIVSDQKAHRALADCLATLQLLHLMAK